MANTLLLLFSISSPSPPFFLTLSFSSPLLPSPLLSSYALSLHFLVYSCLSTPALPPPLCDCIIPPKKLSSPLSCFSLSFCSVFYLIFLPVFSSLILAFFSHSLSLLSIVLFL